jgi:hypothetical protein
MRIAALVLALGLVGCGKSNEEKLKEEIAAQQARAAAGADPTAPAPKVVKQAPEPVKKEVAPPDPEPTTPEEIDTARKKAMIAGKDKDVIRFCEMGKVDEKADPQVLLGCTLAACRVNDADKAKAWAKGVAKSKPLLDQAIKTCMANKVAL